MGTALREVRAEIIANDVIARDVYELCLKLPEQVDFRPGQFVNIEVPGFFLKRPISVCDVDGEILILVYKVFGQGTARLATFTPGERLNLLLPLGNGFEVNPDAERPALAGGGVGTPPLYFLAKELIAAGQKPVVTLGFASKDDVFYADRFRGLGLDVHIATVDGTEGTQGFVTGPLADAKPDYVYCCGPNPMLHSIHDLGLDGQYSFEERMGCGFGACMGCPHPTTDGGYSRICVEGPVLVKEQIKW